MLKKLSIGIAAWVFVGAGCALSGPVGTNPPQPPPPKFGDCTPRGKCTEENPACPAGTYCSGLPAYGCYPDGCPSPICLSADASIATPDGDVPVTSVSAGMLVWTSDGRGGRLAVPVLSVGSADAGPDHRIVHLTLSDGRELRLSPGHPTADGRTAGAVAAGDPLDGATVTGAELAAYAHQRTYDLLPAGPTGTYWANGILMGSTLVP